MEERSLSRRRVLGRIAAVGTGGALAGIPSVTAEEDVDEGEDPLADQPHVDIVDHFELQADGSFSVTTGNTPTNYETKGVAFPWSADELVVHLHAWNASYEGGLIRANRARSTYSDVWWYEPAVVGVTWGSTYRMELLDEFATVTAPKVANFLADFHYWNPDVDIRLQGFSVGAKLLAETLLQLDEWGERDVVTTAIFLAGALPGGSVSLDGKYGSAIERTVDHAENFWDRQDAVLRYRFWFDGSRSAIGNEGSAHPTPANFTDHQVTDIIDGHAYRNWLEPAFMSEWVVPEIVDRRDFGLSIDPWSDGFS